MEYVFPCDRWIGGDEEKSEVVLKPQTADEIQKIEERHEEVRQFNKHYVVGLLFPCGRILLLCLGLENVPYSQNTKVGRNKNGMKIVSSDMYIFQLTFYEDSF